MGVRLYDEALRRCAIPLCLGLGLGLVVACTRSAKPKADRSGMDASTTATASKCARRGGTDVTFAVVSDTHLGHGGMEAANRTLVRSVNAIEGKSYPSAIGGVVQKPAGLFVTGDLTEWGKVDE